MSTEPFSMSASALAGSIQTGELTATNVIESLLARIEKVNPKLNALTHVTVERARSKAEDIDRRIANGEAVGPLAGVPYSVKNLFDVEGVVTLAGSKINRENTPASRDATLVQRMDMADAILVGCANMGEYAYDFTGENAHDGPSRNPHDLAHMSGGSSGGSGSAVAAGLSAISLGSDTNGSIRVPSSFCGLFGLKPTYGRLPRTSTFPFVSSFDHLGPLARSVDDLALTFDVLQGDDTLDPAQSRQPLLETLQEIKKGVAGVRIANAGGYFARNGEKSAFAAVSAVARALEISRQVELPRPDLARIAAYLITMAEGAELHLGRLQRRPEDFDPDVRDRLIAGTMIPGAWTAKAQKFRRWYRDEVLKLFDKVDIIIAPATPCEAPRIGQKTMVLDGTEMLVRANLGIYTQPISFIGLPVVAVPIWLPTRKLPIGVQIIAPPWREDLALRVAAELERRGVCKSYVADLETA